MQKYCCPNCKTNRSRFNLIKQEAQSVKLNPRTGEIEETYTEDQLDPFHVPYRGSAYRIQCGLCGLVEDEERFIRFGKMI